jgi:hypothetical protein
MYVNTNQLFVTTILMTVHDKLKITKFEYFRSGDIQSYAYVHNGRIILIYIW